MNPLPSHTRFIQFAGGAVKLNVDSPSLLKEIDIHFEQCLGVDKSPVAEYQVSAEGEAFSILRDGEVFQADITLQQVLFHLMQDGLVQLNGASSTHLVFHAAALSYQERGLLMCGKSGSGKSTLAAWLTAKGLQYLTDEVTAYPLAGGEVEGFCRSLVLKRGSSSIWERWFANVRPDTFLKMDDGSVWITPSLFASDAVRARVRPHVILFPSYSENAEFMVEPLTPASTLFQLMQCLVNARNFADHGMAAAKELSRKVSAYRFIYSDIEQASTWIEKTLAT